MNDYSASFYPAMAMVAKEGLKNQKVGPKDFYDDEGLLVCGVCGEHRQIMYDFPDPIPGDPLHKRPMKRKRQCLCERKAEEEEERRKKAEADMEAILKLRRASLMDEKFAKATFDNYEETKDNAENLRICRSYVQRFDQMLAKNQGMLFYGNAGTGKSYTAACIANALMAKKIPVMMTSFVRMLDIIKNGDERVDRMMDQMRHAKLVVFDDLGAERGTPYAMEQVYNIVDTRYRQMLPMILTTNRTLKEMKDETDIQYVRIYDRVFENCFPMKFKGDSFRRKTANKRYMEMQKLLKGEEPDE